MKIENIPNRAPNFTAKYKSESAFLKRRNATPISYAKAKKLEPLVDLERVLSSRRLPGGFSNRMLSHEVARSIDARIVSEHEGLIETLLISVPRGEPNLHPVYARHYDALFKGLGSWVNYVVLCDPDNKDEVLQIAGKADVQPGRLTFAFSPQFEYTIWAQDAYVALNDTAGGKILLEGVSFSREEDMTIADDVAAQTEISLLQSYLYFQGGNILGGGDITLIGMDYVQRNVSRYELETEERVIEAYSASLGTEILPLGGELFAHYEWYREGILSGDGFQPIFHIDMYVTPTGVKGASGKEIVFLGRPEAAKKVVGRYSDIPELNNGAYNDLFDRTEEILAKRFEVQYLPLWITKSRLGQPNLKERYYNLTFNNGIVQSGSDMKRVLLPTYSGDAESFGTDKALRQALEKQAADAWRAIGYDVHLMDGIEDLAYGSGAVHCITKVLSRRI